MTYPEDMTPAEIERTDEGAREWAAAEGLAERKGGPVKTVEGLREAIELATDERLGGDASEIARAVVDYLCITEADAKDAARLGDEFAQEGLPLTGTRLTRCADALTLLLAASQEDRA